MRHTVIQIITARSAVLQKLQDPLALPDLSVSICLKPTGQTGIKPDAY